MSRPISWQWLRRRVLYVAVGVAGAVLISAATWSVFRYGVESFGPGLPVLGTVPNFSLLGSDGQRLSQSNLAGAIWVADFIFTRCPGLCPTLTAQMAKLQKAPVIERDPAIRLVSFTVDPTNDTPEALRTYANQFRADPHRWLFVTGERNALHSLIGGGFHLAVAERPPAENTDGEGLITHSDRFVLVDRQLRIRGYYHGTDRADVDRLLGDIEKLRRES